MARDKKTGTLHDYAFGAGSPGKAGGGGSGSGGDDGRRPRKSMSKKYYSGSETRSRKRKAREQDEEDSDDETQSEDDSEGKGKGSKRKKKPNHPRRPTIEDAEGAEYHFHNGDRLILPNPSACVLPPTTIQLSTKERQRWAHFFELVLQWIHLNRQAYAISRDNGMLGQNRAVIREMLENRGSIDPRTGTRHKYRKDPDGKSCKDSITKMKNNLKKFHEPWYDVLAKYEKEGTSSLAAAVASGSANTVPDIESERPAQQEDANVAELKVEDTTSSQPDWTHVQPEASAPVSAGNEPSIRMHRSFPPFSSSRPSYYILPPPTITYDHHDELGVPPQSLRSGPPGKVGDQGESQKTSDRSKKRTKRGSKRKDKDDDDQNSRQAAVRRDRLQRMTGGALPQPLQSDPTDLAPSPAPTPQAAPTSTSGSAAATDLAAVHATEAAGLNLAEFMEYMAEMERKYRENHREGGGS